MIQAPISLFAQVRYFKGPTRLQSTSAKESIGARKPKGSTMPARHIGSGLVLAVLAAAGSSTFNKTNASSEARSSCIDISRCPGMTLARCSVSRETTARQRFSATRRRKAWCSFLPRVRIAQFVRRISGDWSKSFRFAARILGIRAGRCALSQGHRTVLGRDGNGKSCPAGRGKRGLAADGRGCPFETWLCENSYIRQM